MTDHLIEMLIDHAEGILKGLAAIIRAWRKGEGSSPLD